MCIRDRPSGVFTGEQTGSTVTISRDSSNDRFILFLQSYTENIAEDEFPTSQLVAPRGIASFRIGLKRVGIDTSISSIEGVSEILDNQNSGGGSMSLDLAFAVLLDFLTVRYGIPTNFRSRIFEGSEGEPYVVDSGENSYLDLSLIHIFTVHLLSNPFHTISVQIRLEHPPNLPGLTLLNDKVLPIRHSISIRCRTGDEFSPLHPPLIAHPLVLGDGDGLLLG